MCSDRRAAIRQMIPLSLNTTRALPEFCLYNGLYNRMQSVTSRADAVRKPVSDVRIVHAKLRFHNQNSLHMSNSIGRSIVELLETKVRVGE